MKIQEYRSICQKNESENYLFDKYIFRRISIYITVLFIKLNIKANTATLLSLIAALAGCGLLAQGSAFALKFAAVAILCYYMLDHVDGELARYYIKTGKQQPSLRGQYFDLLVHRYSSNLMAFFMGAGLYNRYGCPDAVLLGFIACIGISSFPNLMASRVFTAKIATNREIIHEASAAKILSNLERKREQLQEVNSGAAGKLKKFMLESLFFPGHIILIMIVILLDAYGVRPMLFGYLYSFRYLLLWLFAVLFSIKTVIQAWLWLIKLKEIT